MKKADISIIIAGIWVSTLASALFGFTIRDAYIGRNWWTFSIAAGGLLIFILCSMILSIKIFSWLERRNQTTKKQG